MSRAQGPKIGTIRLTMTRSIPKALAPVIERLELDQPEIVTLPQLAAIAQDVGARTAPHLLAHRLRERGWLLSTGIPGAWEFAPGAHAGAHSRGGPLLPVRAALALEPTLPMAVALSSAAWVYRLADRAPTEIDLAFEPGAHVPAGLARRSRVCRFSAALEPAHERGVPVQRYETMLVHMAARPAHVTSWGGIPEWIGDVVAEANVRYIQTELAGRPRAVSIRLAYLLEGLWPDLASRLGVEAGTKVWFGPRAKLRRHSQRWRVADSILPFAPARLAPVR